MRDQQICARRLGARSQNRPRSQWALINVYNFVTGSGLSVIFAASVDASGARSMVIDKLSKAKSNSEFLANISNL
jgi:hypothetical protein